MALPARTLQTNQREKPRDVPRDVPLAYPAECPALVTHDDVVHAYTVLFLPAFAAGNVVTALHITTNNGKTWPTVRHKKPSLAYVGKALIAHLNAGQEGEPWPLDGEGKIHAIGVRFSKNELTCIMNVDLDGRTNAREFVRAMAENGVRGLLTSSSGKPRKYRFLVFLDRWYTVGEMHELAKKLCESLGFKVEKGAVEIFPSTINGRQPCGYGALTVYDLTNLDDGIELTLPAFLSTVHALPRVELARIVDELKVSAGQNERICAELWSEFEHENAANETRVECAERPLERSRLRGKTRVPKDVLRWEKHGVEPGERQRALLALAMHAWFQKKNEQETAKWLARWVRQGGLRRSNLMHERRDAIGYQIADLPRIVQGIFAICETFTVQTINAPPANLSAADVLLLNADVERVIATKKWTRACVERFAWKTLPRYKGAYVAGKNDDKGRPIVRMHWKLWRDAVTKHADYVGLREALGWFVPVTDYLPQRIAKARYDDESKAYATTWAFVPNLTSDAPKQALGSSWSVMVMRARRLTRKAEMKVQALEFVRESPPNGAA